MNKNCFRVIFNALRGHTLVVGELARAPGQASRSSVSTARWRRGAQPLVFTLTLGWSALTQAAIVADSSAPAAQQPSVVTTPNGVPVVNIQTPNHAGVSHNTYSRFDVERQGAVLNNSAAATQTQLAGAIAGNAHLTNGAARLILNEVNSSDPTLLRGMIEVAGLGAQVVVANPPGIYVNGGGFINTTGATLTTGRPQFQQGNLDSYRVTGGTIQNEGKGFNTQQADYTTMIARAIEVNSHLWAKKLTVITGSNQVQADTHQATPITTPEAAPTVALDVAQLGGMYAEHIFIVGTEAGVGSRNAGRLMATAGSVVVNSDGWHQGGTIYGGETRLKARQDLNHQGGLLGGGSLLQVQAERDVTAQTETLTATCGDADSGQSYSSRTNLGPRARVLVTEPGGIMAVHAGRNADLVAAQVLNAGEGGHTQIRAGHDLKLSTAQVGQHDQLIWDENNHLVQGRYRDVGSQIKTVGTLQLQAGNQLTATAAQVASGVSAQSVAALVQGPLALEQADSAAAPLVSTEQSLEAQRAAGTLQMSAKGIDILPGQATRYLDEAHQKTHSGLFNDKTTTTRTVQQQSVALGSQFIGTQTKMVASEGDLQIHGSNVLGEQGTTLIAQAGNIKITSSENRQRQISTHQVEESGLLTGGGATLTLGERERSQQQQLEGSQQQSSAVGSLLGDVRIWAKQSFQQLGSHLIAPQGNIDVSAAEIAVLDSHHQQQLTQESSSHSSGFSLGVTNPALSAAQTALQLESAASQTDDPRMQALAAAAGGLAAKNSYDAIKTNPQQLGGVNASLSYGQSESHSKSQQSHRTAQRSQIVGRNITLQARSGDATIQGDVQAAEQTQVTASGRLQLLASENRSQQQSEQRSSSSSIGVGMAPTVAPPSRSV